MKAIKETGVHMRYVISTNDVKPKKYPSLTLDNIRDQLKAKVEQIKQDAILAKESDVIKIPSENKLLWNRYKATVWKITEKQPIKRLLNFENRGFRNYHLDHKVSIWYGFKNKIDPKIIGGIDNLEFIPYKQNMLKATKCNFCGAKNMQTVLFI